jgi:TonB-linked SusC/RagA family outer membrane protein
MKFSVFLSFIAILSVLASGTYSQNTEITLNLKSSTVEQVLQEIEKNSEFFFLYNSRLIDVTREVTLDIKGKKITTILDELFAGQEIDYIVKDRQIILSPKNYDKFFDKSLLQEGKIIRGNVVSDDNKPLPGVNVMEEGTLNGTTTVSSPDAILVFSFVGYITEKFPIGLETQINVSLSQDFMDLEEIVVIGYGTVKKKDLTGAIASVKSGDIVTEGSNTAVRALQGKMAGVDIESSGGSPGARNRVLIRGISTVNNGRTDPLYILDGVPVDNIDNILPSDIESIDVLKDASAAAIYGARASNGVVLVTTKLGKKGESRVDIKTTYGWQKLIKKMDVLNSEEWAKVNNAAHDNDETPRLNIADNLPVDANGNIIDTKWQDEIYQVAPVQSYELSASGGGDFYTYSLSGGYYGQEGIVKMTNYDRLNLRLKSEYKKNRIRIGESVLLSNEKWRNMPDGWGGQGGNPVGSAAKMIPAFEVYSDTATGGFAGAYGSVTNVANPVAQLHLQEPKDEYNKIILNLFAELEIFKGLKYKYNIGYSKTFRYTSTYTYKYYVGSFFSSPFTSLYEGREQNNDFLQEHTLNYDKAIGKLSIHALAGFTFQKAQWKSLTGTGLDLPAGLSVMDAAKDPQ